MSPSASTTRGFSHPGLISSIGSFLSLSPSALFSTTTLADAHGRHEQSFSCYSDSYNKPHFKHFPRDNFLPRRTFSAHYAIFPNAVKEQPTTTSYLACSGCRGRKGEHFGLRTKNPGHWPRLTINSELYMNNQYL